MELIRLAESTFTAVAYLTAGLIGTASIQLIPQILPSVLVGVPIGAFIIQRMRAETFRRICMSFDAWVVAFGVSSVLRDIKIVEGPKAFLFRAGIIVIDAWLLWRFFTRNHPTAAAQAVVCAERAAAVNH